MVLRLASGSLLPASAARKRSRAFNVHQRNVVVLAEQPHDLLGLVLPQQAVVDENAGELVADRLVDQHRGDGGIDAARQPGDDARLADLGADLGDLRRAEMRHRPIVLEAGDLVHEVRQQLGAVRRVHHLGVEHGRVDAALLIARHGERRILARRLDGEAVGQPRDAIAMAHPHRIALADLPHAVEQRRGFLDVDLGPAELGRMAALDDAAELHGRRLLAVADGKNGQAAVEHALRGTRRAFRRHRSGAAGQHDRLRLEARHRRLGLIERHDFRVDARLAHPAGDELGHLAAEVDDQDGIGHGRSKVNALSGPIDHPPSGASRRPGAAIREESQGAKKNSLRRVNSCLPVRRVIRARDQSPARNEVSKENNDAIHGDGQGDEGFRSGRDAVRGDARCHGQVQRGDGQSRRHAGRQRAAGQLQGCARPLFGRQAER